MNSWSFCRHKRTQRHAASKVLSPAALYPGTTPHCSKPECAGAANEAGLYFIKDEQVPVITFCVAPSSIRVLVACTPRSPSYRLCNNTGCLFGNSINTFKSIVVKMMFYAPGLAATDVKGIAPVFILICSAPCGTMIALVKAMICVRPVYSQFLAPSGFGPELSKIIRVSVAGILSDSIFAYCTCGVSLFHHTPVCA